MDKLSSSVKNKKTTLKIKGALVLWLLISSPPVPGEEGLPVAFITDLLAALGEHLPLLLVGCVEILLAVYLIGKLLWGKVQHKPSGKGKGAETIFLQEWKRQSEEVWHPPAPPGPDARVHGGQPAGGVGCDPHPSAGGCRQPAGWVGR